MEIIVIVLICLVNKRKFPQKFKPAGPHKKFLILYINVTFVQFIFLVVTFFNACNVSGLSLHGIEFIIILFNFGRVGLRSDLLLILLSTTGMEKKRNFLKTSCC